MFQRKKCLKKQKSRMQFLMIFREPNIHTMVMNVLSILFIKKHRLNEPALHQLAQIIRGADTDSFHLSPQSAGLWAISAGLSYNFKNDNEQLEIGLKIYDALYSWAKYVQEEKHDWNSMNLNQNQNIIQ